MTESTEVNQELLARAARRCAERGVVIPTFAQMRDPDLVPSGIKARLQQVGLADTDPANLFRISWRNEPVSSGGLFNDGNWLEFPSELTGVDARIVGLVGKWFPTGCHKVGAAFGCLVPRLVTGQFDPERNKAVWPSTGNFCRGGAFDCALLGCHAVGILPEEMSAERFAWLEAIGAEVIATHGCESNVKEIYDACWEIRRTRPDCVIFNQFEELGNPTWHYHVTGDAAARAFAAVAEPDSRMAAWVSATGSAGTLAAGDYLKTLAPSLAIVAAEALQCPTLLAAGFGGHRIEGIGDKHVPWIHNVRNTDVVVAVDDEQCLALARLFNEPEGRECLLRLGVAPDTVGQLGLAGLSSLCNLVAAIKTARLFGLDRRDVLLLPLTDSMDMYKSRLTEQREQHGAYDALTAARHFGRYLEGIGPDHVKELSFADRKALHNLKYFTWVEQQGRTVEDLNALWEPDFWAAAMARVEQWDLLIDAFNQRVEALSDTEARA